MSSQAKTQTKQQTTRPPEARVLLLNDDYTPMDFVLLVLQRFFHKDALAAQRIMLEAHQQGVSVAGVYPYEVAETKRHQVARLAQREGYPLRLELDVM
jgi:ATP-dependent Clp protease adaptor protein ClpS